MGEGVVTLHSDHRIAVELAPHRLYRPSPLILVNIRNGIGAVFLTVAPLLVDEEGDGGRWCAGYCNKVI